MKFKIHHKQIPEDNEFCQNIQFDHSISKFTGAMRVFAVTCHVNFDRELDEINQNRRIERSHFLQTKVFKIT
jgi:hypothetical protein